MTNPENDSNEYKDELSRASEGAALDEKSIMGAAALLGLSGVDNDMAAAVEIESETDAKLFAKVLSMDISFQKSDLDLDGLEESLEELGLNASKSIGVLTSKVRLNEATEHEVDLKKLAHDVVRSAPNGSMYSTLNVDGLESPQMCVDWGNMQDGMDVGEPDSTGRYVLVNRYTLDRDSSIVEQLFPGGVKSVVDPSARPGGEGSGLYLELSELVTDNIFQLKKLLDNKASELADENPEYSRYPFSSNFTIKDIEVGVIDGAKYRSVVNADTKIALTA